MSAQTLSFEEAERLNLPKIVHIPFANQEAKFVQLIRKYKSLFIGILNKLHEEINTPVTFYLEDEVIRAGTYTPVSANWDQYLACCKKVSSNFFPSRLVHLKPYDFHIDEDGEVNLLCLYDSKGLDKYIPESVKVCYFTNDELIDRLLEIPMDEVIDADLSDLYWFTPFTYVVPCFGKY